MACSQALRTRSRQGTLSVRAPVRQSGTFVVVQAGKRMRIEGAMTVKTPAGGAVTRNGFCVGDRSSPCVVGP